MGGGEEKFLFQGKFSKVCQIKPRIAIQYPCHMDNYSKSVKRGPLFKSVNIQQRKLYN